MAVITPNPQPKIRLLRSPNGMPLDMDDEQTLFAEWVAARDAYDEHLQRLFMPTIGREPERPSPEVLEEAARLRELEEVARLRYHESRGLSGT